MTTNDEGAEALLELRPLRLEDFDRLVALELACFPRMKPWSREQFESQLATFPEGQLGVFLGGELVASSAALVLDYANYSDWSDWLELSDRGFIRNHDPEGDTLYGIEMMVHPAHRGKKLARRLYDARKSLCRKLHLKRMIIGGRIPGYAAHAARMTAGEYVKQVTARTIFDEVLTAQVANGFQLRELVPDYLPSDEDSAGWATCLEWVNLDHIGDPRAEPHRTRRAVSSMRVSAVQYGMRPIATFDDFARQVEFFVDVASDGKSDFVVFPELFTLQLLSLARPERPGRAARELAGWTDRVIALLRDLAVRYDVNIVGGTQFVLEEERLTNVAFLFHRDGRIDQQAKIHVTPNERKWWGVQPGRDIAVFDTDRGRVGILVCYDVEFPELARAMVDQGARVLFVPFNTNDNRGHLRVRLRAGSRDREPSLRGDVRLRREPAAGRERRHPLRSVGHLYTRRRLVRARGDRGGGPARDRDRDHAGSRHRALATRTAARDRADLGRPATRPVRADLCRSRGRAPRGRRRS